MENALQQLTTLGIPLTTAHENCYHDLAPDDPRKTESMSLMNNVLDLGAKAVTWGGRSRAATYYSALLQPHTTIPPPADPTPESSQRQSLALLLNGAVFYNPRNRLMDDWHSPPAYAPTMPPQQHSSHVTSFPNLFSKASQMDLPKELPPT